MSPLAKCIGIAAVLATALALGLAVFVLWNSKVGSGVGKVLPLLIVAGWILAFAATFVITSISLYLRARLKKDSPAQIRELGFTMILSLLVVILLGASVITRMN